MKRKLLAVFMVATLVIASSSAPVSAGNDFGGDWVKELGWAVTFPTFGDLLGWNQEHEDMEKVTDNATHTDMYEGLLGQKTQQENAIKAVSDYTQDSRTFAFVKAEGEIVDGLANGSTESTVNNSARSTVFDYYTASQEGKLVDSWNIKMHQMDYVLTRAQATSGLNVSDVVAFEKTGAVTATTADGSTSYDYVDHHVEYVGLVNESYTMVNGSAETVKALKFRVVMTVDTTTGGSPRDWETNYVMGVDSADWSIKDGLSSVNWTTVQDGYDRNGDIPTDSITVYGPSGSSLSPFKYATDTRTDSELNQVGTVSTQVADNADVYASALYDAKQNGTLDAANYTSPYLQAQEYATDYNSTGYWSYAIAMLSSTGTATPDLNQTSVMYVEYNGITHEGLVMASQFPNGTLETNVTYDGSNTTAFGERAWLVTTAGERLVLSGQFTVTEMTDKDGNSVNQTKEVVYTYEGVNMTDYRNQQELIKELMLEIQEREPAGSGGSGSDSGIKKEYILLAVVALAGAAMYGGKK